MDCLTDSCQLITNPKDWILSFKGNNNTGVEEEIYTGIYILMGTNLFRNEHIDIEEKYKNIICKEKFNNILGIINLSQKDNVGGTADIAIKYQNGTIKFYSITQWKNQLSKCICNPSGKYYGLKKTQEIENINESCYNIALDYRKKNFGELPNKLWKRVPSCPGSNKMAEFLSKMASKSWNLMDIETKRKNLIKFMDLNNKQKTNSQGIIYWDKKSKSIKHIYNWELNINVDDYLDTFSQGIYIYHGKPNNYILKTQVKYNNGIIEGISSKLTPEQWEPKKSSNYLSSWNVVAINLNKIFKMTKIYL